MGNCQQERLLKAEGAPHISGVQYVQWGEQKLQWGIHQMRWSILDVVGYPQGAVGHTYTHDAVGYTKGEVGHIQDAVGYTMQSGIHNMNVQTVHEETNRRHDFEVQHLHRCGNPRTGRCCT